MKRKQIWLLASILLIAACNHKKENSDPIQAPPVTHIMGIGKITPQGGVSELASPASGIVTKVRFKAGDTVKVGDVLLAVDETDEVLSVRETDSRIVSQRHAVESVKSILLQEKLALAEKFRRLKDARELLEVGAATGENVRTLQNEYDLGVERLKKLESDYKMQQAQLDETTIQRTSGLAALERRQFRTPIEGILLDITPRVGEAVDLHETYARISPEGPLIVRAEIDELFADKLAVGQRCSLKLTGGDSVLSTDEEILHISPDLKRKSLFSDSGTDLEDRRVREIEISLRHANTTPLIDTKVECVVHLN
ncbi:HlyD family efflux transporter periplasmic adaptor subunit [uncultured Proteiniphilum sp.]|uniref:HlyD family secretion protein n=1 Tax=uncultured Proteiniphilum sp. TaxID=497637 RepID=UPI0026370CDF|nr:HlyD family efflux transporter periplasmic adaptor subunit [uncultured Proteiniphilum sp.]